MEPYGYINSATVCGLASSVIILLRTLPVFFLKLGKLDNEVIVTGREFQIFGPW